MNKDEEVRQGGPYGFAIKTTLCPPFDVTGLIL